jgi:RNA polymerase sigma factor (sigma-70 family)
LRTGVTAVAENVLVARCKAGDAEAWRELVHRYSRYVYAIVTQAYRLYDSDAEDVFQEVFLRAYEQLDGLRDESAIRPWLGQLTRRLCIDQLRSLTRHGTDAIPEIAETDRRLERIEEAICVHGALASLPDECREVLDRFFCRDESYAQITAALDLPPGTVASRISRCLARLRREYDRDS